MPHLCCTAQFVAVLLLSGCGTIAIFGEYDLPEDPKVEAAPWPRLVDTPAAPTPGQFTSSVPDPATGTAVNQNLRTEAAVAAVRARELSAPILSDAARDALFKRAEEARKASEAAKAADEAAKAADEAAKAADEAAKAADEAAKKEP